MLLKRIAGIKIWKRLRIADIRVILYSMNVTIKEVAELAGVSPATVSRAMHDNKRISAGTREKVKLAAEKLGYIPNAAARSLAGTPSRTLGLVLPNNSDQLFKNPFFINAMRGISIYAQEHGYFLLYSFSRDENEEIQFIRNYIKSGWVSGIVLLTSRGNDRCVSYLHSVDYPFVVIGRPEDPAHTLWVDNDNFHAMYRVVNHLQDQGYRRIAFIGGPESFRVTRDRLMGYRQALTGRGRDIDESIIYQGDDFTEEQGRAGAAALLDRNAGTGESCPAVDAFAATDDQLAFGVLAEIEARGLTGIGVTGFNNTPRGSYQSPSLTSVDVSPDMLGRSAAELLITSLEGREPERDHYIVDTRLVERESSRRLD